MKFSFTIAIVIDMNFPFLETTRGGLAIFIDSEIPGDANPGKQKVLPLG